MATVPPQAPTLDTVYDDVAPHADYLQKGDVTNDTTPDPERQQQRGGRHHQYLRQRSSDCTTSVAGNGGWASRRMRRAGERQP